MMKKLIPAIFLLSVLFTFTCDKKNIVEPRFYPADNEINRDKNYYMNAERTIAYYHFYFDRNRYVEIYVISSTGERIKTLINGGLEAGYHTLEWNLTDSNNNPVDKGIYAFVFFYGSYGFSNDDTFWFEI